VNFTCSGPGGGQLPYHGPYGSNPASRHGLDLVLEVRTQASTDYAFQKASAEVTLPDANQGTSETLYAPSKTTTFWKGRCECAATAEVRFGVSDHPEYQTGLNQTGRWRVRFPLALPIPHTLTGFAL